MSTAPQHKLRCEARPLRDRMAASEGRSGAASAPAEPAEPMGGFHHTASLWRGGAKVEQTAEALRTYLSNILDRPSELRFRRIRELSSGFSSRVARCAGAMIVLQRCGFERVEYPDGFYWVLKHVDAALLDAVRTELNIGLSACARMRQTRQRVAIHETTEQCEVAAGAQAAVLDEQHEAAPKLLGGCSLPDATAGYQQRRQLQARAVIHRVRAAQMAQERQRRWRSVLRWGLAAAVTLAAVGVLPWLRKTGHQREADANAALATPRKSSDGLNFGRWEEREL